MRSILLILDLEEEKLKDSAKKEEGKTLDKFHVVLIFIASLNHRCPIIRA